MTTQQEIDSLNWHNAISKLKLILKKLTSSPVDSRPYKVYTALLTQSGTIAPTAIVLENTFGETFTWTYNSVGVYDVTVSNGAFIYEKTTVYVSNDYNGFSLGAFNDVNIIRIISRSTSYADVNNVLYMDRIEIRLYN